MDKLEKFQKMIKNLKQKDEEEKNLYKIKQLFNMQDYAKELLHNSTTKRQEESARSFLNRIDEELKMLYTPTPIDNV